MSHADEIRAALKTPDENVRNGPFLRALAKIQASTREAESPREHAAHAIEMAVLDLRSELRSAGTAADCNALAELIAPLETILADVARDARRKADTL